MPIEIKPFKCLLKIKITVTKKKKKSKHWVGQKVRLSLSVTSYGKFRTNRLANPAPLSASPIKAVKRFGLTLHMHHLHDSVFSLEASSNSSGHLGLTAKS